MKKRIWLTLLVLVVVVIVGSRSSAFFEQRSSPEIVESAPVATPPPQPELQEVKDELQVSVDKLLAHIQQLNFQRYTKTERSRTRTYIINELRKSGWTPKLEKFSGGVNVFAERPGTDNTGDAILVAAHYDTVVGSPGADDNASGVAVILEIARLFASHPTPRTLQLAFFDLEEAGLVGSKAFVTNTQRLEKLRGVIVMDMVGYACYTAGCQQYPPGLPVTPPSDKGDFLVAVGDIENLSLLKAFNHADTKNLPSVLTIPIPLKGLLTPDTLRSDHAPFWYQGIGAVLVTDTANLRTPHYHQPTDTPSNIEQAFFVGAAQIVVNAVNTLVNSQ
ncbi:M28 family peptidase [Trichormus variabilis ARAD]|nr:MULTISPECIES: M28 family peptidase [Nostocaceae]MBC1214543.1 M28 family peptidase [Trichormus variabilis ARAD]MBC1257486.1 M28 family peptidase [Trichormus variabilis V5]MBC1266222.1 M28 family peptidase [Trichormus variabilis FSR]MBC1301633.1 M28 family peptidase [Trichormus variabilis N2B]MBC1311325.1 M28 family peptidase [Trichormus variabilis PNB]